MGDTIIYKFKGISIVSYLVRLICIASIIYILTIFQENPPGLATLMIIVLAIFFYSSTQKVVLKNNCIIFCNKRILSILDKEQKIIYNDIKKIEFKERRVNYITLILPGLSSIKDAEFIFYFQNGGKRKEILRGNQKEIREMYKMICDKYEFG